MTDAEKRQDAQNKIVQLENRIEEHRLADIPDLEAISHLQDAIDDIRAEFLPEKYHRVYFAPV